MYLKIVSNKRLPPTFINCVCYVLWTFCISACKPHMYLHVCNYQHRWQKKNQEEYPNTCKHFFEQKHQPDLKSTFKEGQPPLLCSKDSAITKGPRLEMKSPPALLSLFIAYARQETAIGPWWYTVTDHCFIVIVLSIWHFEGCWDLMYLLTLCTWWKKSKDY